jgi:molybdopterin-guanine dinucleotide biosynthesis protein A
LADPLAAELRGGGRKMRDVIARLGGVSAPLDAHEQVFFNINTKADLEQASEIVL